MSWSAAQQRYSKSTLGRASRRKYQMSEKGKASRIAYLARRKAKLAEAIQETVVPVEKKEETVKIKKSPESKKS